MKFWRTKEFKRLQKKWYKKARDSGFRDEETVKPGQQNTPFLAKNTMRISKLYKPGVEEHYRRCRIHLHENEFEDEFKKQLFAWYTEGYSYRNIVKLIKEVYDTKRSVFYVHTHVKKLLTEMEDKKLWEAE